MDFNQLFRNIKIENELRKAKEIEEATLIVNPKYKNVVNSEKEKNEEEANSSIKVSRKKRILRDIYPSSMWKKKVENEKENEKKLKKAKNR